MPKKDDAAPATKKDVSLLMRAIGRSYDANEKWKDEILGANEKWKDEIIGEFHIIVGQLRHDFKGAFADKLQQHENRIVRVERHLRLAA
ncbi:MAG: hypothetical protein AAB853_00075 [Patescibacteria group bacterium]